MNENMITIVGSPAWSGGSGTSASSRRCVTLTELRKYIRDTDEFNNHPAMQLFASKVHNLTGVGFSDHEPFSRAYDACAVLAKPINQSPGDSRGPTS